MSIAPFELYPKIQIPAPWNSIPIYKPNVSVHQICCYNSLHHQRHRKGIQHVLNRMYNTASWLSVKDESLSPWQQRRIGMTMNSRLRISTSSHAELSSCAACSPLAEPNHLINDTTALQLLLLLRLRSASKSTLVIPTTRRTTLSDRAFSVTAARARNALPSSVRSAPSLLQFRRDLKTTLFQSSYSSP